MLRTACALGLTAVVVACNGPPPKDKNDGAPGGLGGGGIGGGAGGTAGNSGGGGAGTGGASGAAGDAGMPAGSPPWAWTVRCPDAHDPTTPIDYGRCALDQALAEAGVARSIELATVAET
ncbi:MAG TPA: hypothetical protein VIQ54_22470, partial [Polyangia bacterium]